MLPENSKELPQDNHVRLPLPVSARVNMNLPQYYANACSVGLSLTDIQITSTVNGGPVLQLIIPLSTALSLKNSLTKAINDFENKVNTKVLDLKEVQELMKTK